MADYFGKHHSQSLAVPLIGDTMWVCVLKKVGGWLVTWGNYLALAAIAGVASWAFFSHQDPPIIIKDVSVVSQHVHVNEPLQLQIHALVNKQHCSIYAERTVTKVGGEVVWTNLSPVSADVIVKEINSEQPIQVYIPDMVPGNYFYAAKLHMICGTKAEVIPTPLIPFTVDP